MVKHLEISDELHYKIGIHCWLNKVSMKSYVTSIFEGRPELKNLRSETIKKADDSGDGNEAVPQAKGTKRIRV